MNGLAGIFTFEVEQLGADLVGDLVVDVGTQHDHPVLEEAIEDSGARIETTLEGLR